MSYFNGERISDDPEYTPKPQGEGEEDPLDWALIEVLNKRDAEIESLKLSNSKLVEELDKVIKAVKANWNPHTRSAISATLLEIALREASEALSSFTDKNTKA